MHLKDKPAKRYRGNSELQPLEPRYKFDVACRTHAMQTSPLLHSPYSLLEKTFFFFFFSGAPTYRKIEGCRRSRTDEEQGVTMSIMMRKSQ